MELSNDQKAILRLLAQRGPAGYDDLSALLGIDAAEVHERALAAAAQLEADGIPAPEIPAPDATGPVPPAEPEPPAQPAPPDQPELPAEPPSPAPAPPPAQSGPVPPRPAPSAPSPRAAGRSSRAPKLSLPKGNGARAALAAGALVLVAIVVILLVGGGGDSGDTTAASGDDGGSINVSSNPKLTQAVLSPVDGGEARGVATFGRLKNSLALQVEAEGLEPTAKGESYTVWLYESAKKMIPLASTTVGENGKIGAQVEVPTEVLAYLANETFDQLDVSLTTDATLKAALVKATKERKSPIYTGTDVLRGTITGPIVGAASR